MIRIYELAIDRVRGFEPRVLQEERTSSVKTIKNANQKRRLPFAINVKLC